MHPKKTYELSLIFTGESAEQTKQSVIHWLIGFGEESFVEGEISGIDIDFDYSQESRDQYRDLGGDVSPIKIYRYDLEYLRDLKARLQQVFGSHLRCEESSLATEVWMEGWKESFKPIESRRFYVYPPWDVGSRPDGKIGLEIEPGMAFGTGQHATTQLCLELIEERCTSPGTKVLDVGTGTGILAIALHKLGWSQIQATDIDPDAVQAASENAERNGVMLQLSRESVPPGERQSCDLVIANILAVVLKRILPDLSAAAKEGGAVMLSGILLEERDLLIELASQVKLNLCAEKQRDGWWAALFEKGT